MADDNAQVIAALKGADQAAMQPETFVNPVAQHALAGIFNMPKNLIDAAKVSAAHHYGPSPDTMSDSDVWVDPLPAQTANAAMMLSGLGAPAAEAGAAGMFGGRLALTADHKALQEAERMRMGGVHPADVLRDTGWMRSPMDSKWQFEIPDNKMALKYMPTTAGDRAIGSVDSLVSHPEAFKAYPQLRDARFELGRDDRRPLGSGYFTSAHPDTLRPLIEVNAPNMQVGRSVAAHELQHGIQDIEGFTKGASPERYARTLEQSMRDTGNMGNYNFGELDKQSRDFYHRTAGEVQSRNVQERLDYNPVQRKLIPPWETQDVPFDKQLLVEALKNFK